MSQATPEHIEAVRQLATTMNGVRVALEETAYLAAKDMGADAAAWLHQAENAALNEVKNIDAVGFSEQLEASGIAGAIGVIQLSFNEVRKRLGLPHH